MGLAHRCWSVPPRRGCARFQPLSWFESDFFFGDITCDLDWTFKSRELATIADLTAIGTAGSHTSKPHIHAALNGVAREEVVEVISNWLYMRVSQTINGMQAAK